ncbi:protein transport [Sparganum proliferum]
MRPLRKKSKNSSYFSHDFIIENHGDIVSVVAMVFIVGMLFKGTAPVASLFISMQHNESVEKTSGPPDLLYTTGRYDFCAIFFYSTVAIILHAVAQEYMLDGHSFTKLGIVLLIIHYTTDAFYHFARMMKFYGWPLGAKLGFSIFNGLYVPSRVICTVLAFLTFYYGLPQYSVPTMSVSDGNFNTWLIRLNCMLFVLLTQAHMVWTFVNYQLRKIREQKAQQMINAMYTTNADLQRRREKKKGKREEDSKESPDAHSSDVHQRKRK